MKGFKTYSSRAVILLLTPISFVFSARAQAPNNSCSNAQELCPGITVSGNNEDANATVCQDCEDDFTFCFSGTNTVWYTFKTNETGGDVTVSFSNLVFVNEANRGTALQAVIVEAAVLCNSSTFTIVSNCEAGASGNFSLSATGLTPSTTYYVIVNGQSAPVAALPAEASFDITAQGTGIDRPQPAVFVGGPGLQICPKQSVNFVASLANCPDSTAFIWKVNGETAAVTEENVWFTSSIKDGDIVTVETTCYGSCAVPVTNLYGPIAVENLYVNAGPDQSLNPGQNITLNGSTNGTSWYWSPAISLSDPTSLNPLAYPENTTSYFLTASSDNCTLSDEVIISIEGRFNIPGSFSPNGDGVNDTWIITGIDQYPNANVVLFDRWGQRIADIVGYSNQKSWDGTNKGKAVTDGVYFYQIDLRDEQDQKPLTGYVTVLR